MGDLRIKDEAVQIMGVFKVLPRLVVFDLDYTLRPFYCECRSKREMPSMYPHAKGILHALKDKGVDIAIASRSPTPDIATTFLDKLGIKTMFVAEGIYSSFTHKTEHFKKINRKTGVPYNSMLFFDDENRNIEAVSKMGVTSILVNKGVNLDALKQGLTKFSKHLSSIEKNKEKWKSFFSEVRIFRGGMSSEDFTFITPFKYLCNSTFESEAEKTVMYDGELEVPLDQALPI